MLWPFLYLVWTAQAREKQGAFSVLEVHRGLEQRFNPIDTEKISEPLALVSFGLPVSWRLTFHVYICSFRAKTGAATIRVSSKMASSLMSSNWQAELEDSPIIAT